jgi:hypothetical protein
VEGHVRIFKIMLIIGFFGVLAMGAVWAMFMIVIWL